MKSIIGLIVVAAHAVLFALYVPSCRRPELALELKGGVQEVGFPTAQPDEVHGEGVAGLGYRRYTTRYRGGFTRSVGIATYEPRRANDKPACTGRVVVGQKLLDDGKASPGTIAGEMMQSMTDELAGESYFPIGEFEKVESVSLSWRELAKHPEDIGLVGAAQHYVYAKAVLVFDRISIPIFVAMVPEMTAEKLSFTITAIAQLQIGNGVAQWLSDKLGGDALATRLARRQIDETLITTIGAPPPFTLPDGQELTFVYCDGAFETIEGVSAALPFGVAIGKVAARPELLPPKQTGPARYLPLSPNATLAIDLAIDGANELLFELWRTGFLDRQLAKAGLDRKFNEDPIVTEYLTLRISPPRLAHPPVVGSTGQGLAMFADARVTIRDGEQETIGRVWGGLDFTFAGGLEPIVVNLGALELSCEKPPAFLVPCYADLVGALRDRGSEFGGELTRTFATLLDDIFVDQRVGASGLTADIVIRAARTSLVSEPGKGSLHIELDAGLVPKR